jgi:hypothetical protein
MIGYGANVTDGQIAPLVDYMFKTYGKKPAAAAPSTASNATPVPSTPANDPVRRFSIPHAQRATVWMD